TLTCLSQTLKIAWSAIDPNAPFSDYGVDSILGTSFIRKVNEALGLTLHPAILFDYPTVQRPVSHVLTTHRHHGARRLHLQAPASHGGPAAPTRAQTLSQGERGPLPLSTALETVATPAPIATDIAIIGMAGQFPGATDVHLFWDNLIHGRDVIGTLPAH